MGAYHYGPLDIGKMRTRSIRQRKSKVEVDDFAQIYKQGSGITGLLRSLPKILTGLEFRKVVEAILGARSKGKLVIWGLGGHVIKCGLSPILIDLMQRGFISALSVNGASAIHDFEIAMVGSTSEDVEKTLLEGDFGTSEETGQ